MRDELLNLMPDDLLNLIWVNIKPSVKYSLNKKNFNRYYFYRFGYINNKVLFRYKNLSMYECYFINNLNYIKYLIRNDSKFVLDNIINFKFKYDNTNFMINSLNEENILPIDFKLHDPYPNPFNPIVNIDFDISEKGNVELSIYDLRGRLLERLINNKIYEPGVYNFKWSAENYASGLYLVKFHVADKQSIKKITLLK